MKRSVAMLLVLSLVSVFMACGAAFAADLVGTLGDDRLSGSEGPDTLRGLAGDDRLLGFGGMDTISGGDGRDAVLGSGEEFVVEGASKLFGGGDGDFIGGTIGADMLRGGAGDDYLYAGPIGESASDVDSVTAGSGDDAVFARNVPAARDVVKCGPGTDMALVDDRDLTVGCEKQFTSVNRFFDAVPGYYFDPLYSR